MKKRAKSFVLAIIFAVAMLVGAVTPAKQAWAGGECGSSYALVGNYAMYNEIFTKRTGTLEIYWSNSAGRNCAIARAYGDNYGKRLWREVYLKLSSSSTVYSDKGYFYYYAGPVYSPPSAGKCIDAQGNFYTNSSRSNLVGRKVISNAHCG